tara:strand:- start:451 stop:957 length:507 start_codon:yes stop_codon:yes gene_type:complete
MTCYNIRTVAIVEDDALLLKAVERYFDRKSIEVLAFEHMPTAEQVAGQSTPDVIILDAHLHEGSGVELVEQVRKLWPGVPIVIWTGDGSKDLRTDCLAAGCDEVVIKGSAGYSLLSDTVFDAYVRRQGWLSRNAGDAVAAAKLAVDAARDARPSLQRLLSMDGELTET